MDEASNNESGANVGVAPHTWAKTSEFVLSHPSGWKLTRYSVHGQWRYLLWGTDDKARGPFSSADEGKAEFDRIAPAWQPGETTNQKDSESAEAAE